MCRGLCEEFVVSLVMESSKSSSRVSKRIDTLVRLSDAKKLPWLEVKDSGVDIV